MFKRLCVAAVLLTILTASPAMVVAEHAEQGRRGGAEPHPHIRGALMELREARKELETAAHDFGGHRKEAIEAVDQAIKQLQQALQYDKK